MAATGQLYKRFSLPFPMTLAAVVLMLLFCTAALAMSPPPDADWRTLETPHFRINFATSNRQQAQRLGEIAESVYEDVCGLLQWYPNQKTEVNLFDYTDDTHGWADVIPYPIEGIFITPPDTGELLTNDDWLTLVFIHEFIHIVHLDQTHGTAAGLQQLFGRHRWLFPNRLQPAWLTEGLATYGESLLSQSNGEGNDGGRTQSPQFEALMRIEVAKGIKSLREINAPANTWPLNAAYLYGSYFYLFIEDVYGKPAIQKLTKNYGNNVIPFRIVSNPLKVTGKKLPVLWQEFEHWLQLRFEPQIARLQSQELIQGQAISHSGFFSSSPTQNQQGQLFYIEHNGRSHPHIVRRDRDGTLHRLADVQHDARLDSHINSGLLITQPELCGQHQAYYDIFVLRPDERTPRQLTHCARYRLASWHPDGQHIAAIKVSQGIPAIVLLDDKGETIHTLYEGNEGEVFNSIDWSSDGQQLLLSAKINQQWDIFLFKPGNKQWQALTHDTAIQTGARFSDDGTHIVYSGEHQGYINLQLLNLSTQQSTAITRQLGTAIQPSSINRDGVLSYVSISDKGQDIYQIDVTAKLFSDSHDYSNGVSSDMKSKDNKSITQIPKATTGFSVKPYEALKSLSPLYWEPYWQTDDGDSTALGFTSGGRDAIGIHQYSVKLLKETDLNEYFGRIGYAYDQQLYLTTNKSLNVLAVLDDEPVIYKTNTDYQMLYRFPFDTLLQSWQINPAYSFERVKFKSREHTLKTVRENVLGVNLRYSNVKQWLLSHGPAQGRSVELIIEDYDMLANDFTGQVLTLDWHEYIPLQHTTVAIRFMQGWGNEQPTPFEIGGIFSEYENGIPRINQRDYALRGYRNRGDGLSGRRARLLSTEWRIPFDLTPQSLMLPPLGISRFSTVLFVESGAAWQDGKHPDDYYSSNGIELIGQLVFGYNLTLDTRLGYAHGFDRIGEDRIYIRFGRAF